MFPSVKFENDVEMYGAQTTNFCVTLPQWFENDVEMYGAQTCNTVKSVAIEFENDVEMYGAQTTLILTEDTVGLRMM